MAVDQITNSNKKLRKKDQPVDNYPLANLLIERLSPVLEAAYDAGMGQEFKTHTYCAGLCYQLYKILHMPLLNKKTNEPTDNITQQVEHALADVEAFKKFNNSGPASIAKLSQLEKRVILAKRRKEVYDQLFQEVQFLYQHLIGREWSPPLH